MNLCLLFYVYALRLKCKIRIINARNFDQLLQVLWILAHGALVPPKLFCKIDSFFTAKNSLIKLPITKNNILNYLVLFLHSIISFEIISNARNFCLIFLLESRNFMRRTGRRGRLLPSARKVSTFIHKLATPKHVSSELTSMHMLWGQFIDHDITLTPLVSKVRLFVYLR